MSVCCFKPTPERKQSMKTSELTGAALDWAVAKCEGIPAAEFIALQKLPASDAFWQYNYSTNWSQGGPIIEREIISVSHDTAGQTIEWAAWTPAPIRDEAEAFGYGPTPLIAAMRCYVASKLGDTVDVPPELV
jgi:hypothetical protein